MNRADIRAWLRQAALDAARLAERGPRRSASGEPTTIPTAELVDSGLSRYPAARAIYFADTGLVVCREHACDASFRKFLSQLQAPDVPIVLLFPDSPEDKGCLRCSLTEVKG